ncbi:hypothetical protein SLEP1_g10695 [Rubroshorea leprosula]|uniref:Uncharacterized protein n=1 Tax=Rubroshorea leprosula TaxID=152421 RepID=A0AAV5IES5_9ROSI|nr:hypothetical protein SLEP1_g10695 [Rubroshorea leprosula]
MTVGVNAMEALGEVTRALPYRLLAPFRLLAETSSDSDPVDAVIFVGLSLVLGIGSRHVLGGTKFPYTVALLIIGIALGSLGLRHLHFHRSLA